MNDRLSTSDGHGPADPRAAAAHGAADVPDQAGSAPRFPLPQLHRRYLACAAVAASVALGGLSVGATVEAVRHDTVASAATSH